MKRPVLPNFAPSRIIGVVGAVITVLALVLVVGCADDAGSQTSTPEKSPATSSDAGKGEAMGLAAIDAFIEEQDIDTSTRGWKTSLPKPTQAEFAGDETIFWDLDTNVGPIRIKLMPSVAPMHVTSTVYLTKLGFYDDVVFHRVIDGFMAQGGDPLGTGGGGPGFHYSGEFHKKAKHDERGVVSMANSGPRTDGSQFFVLFGEAPHLDGKHTVFGQVVEGLGTLRSMEAAGSEDGNPRRNIVIEKAEILTS